MSSTEYLEHYHVSLYLEDVVKLLLDSRDERPLEFIAEYFNSVQRGDHVLVRDFEFVDGSPYNRLCLMVRAFDAFASFDRDHPVSAEDTVQLVALLCPDFPRELVLAAARLAQPVDRGGNKYAAPSILIHLRCLFYYSEFLGELDTIFFKAQNSEDSNMCQTILSQARALCDSETFSCPSKAVIERNVWPLFEAGFEPAAGLSVLDEFIMALAVDPETEDLFDQTRPEPPKSPALAPMLRGGMLSPSGMTK